MIIVPTTVLLYCMHLVNNNLWVLYRCNNVKPGITLGPIGKHFFHFFDTLTVFVHD